MKLQFKDLRFLILEQMLFEDGSKTAILPKTIKRYDVDTVVKRSPAARLKSDFIDYEDDDKHTLISAEKFRKGIDFNNLARIFYQVIDIVERTFGLEINQSNVTNENVKKIIIKLIDEIITNAERTQYTILNAENFLNTFTGSKEKFADRKQFFLNRVKNDMQNTVHAIRWFLSNDYVKELRKSNKAFNRILKTSLNVQLKLAVAEYANLLKKLGVDVGDVLSRMP